MHAACATDYDITKHGRVAKSRGARAFAQGSSPLLSSFVVRAARPHRHFVASLDELCSECVSNHACSQNCDFHCALLLLSFESLCDDFAIAQKFSDQILRCIQCGPDGGLDLYFGCVLVPIPAQPDEELGMWCWLAHFLRRSGCQFPSAVPSGLASTTV